MRFYYGLRRQQVRHPDRRAVLVRQESLSGGSVLPECKQPLSGKLARRVLAESEDGGIVYISVGSLPNAARLLESPPDEISPLTGACRAVEFSLRGFLRRRTPSRSQKPFAPSYQALSAHCIPIVFIATVCGFWLSLHLFAILLFPTSPSNALIDRYKLAV